MALVILVCILFFIVCIWEFLPSWQMAGQMMMESFVANNPVDVKGGFAIGMKDEQLTLSRKPKFSFSMLKQSLEALSPDNMSLVFEVTLNEEFIPEQDLISFETLTHKHRVSLMKNGPERKIKVVTEPFAPETNCTTNHCESIRLYEFNLYVDKSKKELEPVKKIEEPFRKKKFEPITVQYALVYEKEHTILWENGVELPNVFSQVNQVDPISKVIDFGKEDVLVFVGSSDVEEDGGYLVRNLVLYNRLLTEVELNALAMKPRGKK
jgi:hypothetical protein